MPYDITDAKDDIKELAAAINHVYKVLVDKNIMEAPKQPEEQAPVEEKKP